MVERDTGDVACGDVRMSEEAKIECARKFFASLNDKRENHGVRYDVVDSYDSLLQLVGG